MGIRIQPWTEASVCSMKLLGGLRELLLPSRCHIFTLFNSCCPCHRAFSSVALIWSIISNIAVIIGLKKWAAAHHQLIVNTHICSGQHEGLVWGSNEAFRILDTHPFSAWAHGPRLSAHCDSSLCLWLELVNCCCCLTGDSRIKYLRLKEGREEEGVSMRTWEGRIPEDKPL